MKAASEPVSASDCMDLVRNLAAINKAVVGRISPILEERFGIDLRLLVILKAIGNGGVHPTELARCALESPSQISRSLDKLERLNLVRRSLDPQDSRKIQVAITPHGGEILAGVDGALAAILAPALKPLPAQSRRALIKAAADLAARLTSPPPEEGG